MLNVLILMSIIIFLSLICKDKNLEENKLFLSHKYTEIMKGIAILLVLINHIGRSYKVSIVEPLGAVGVCIFLILSGFGVNESYKFTGKKNYFIKRFKKVIIPYWIICIIYLFTANEFSIKLFIEWLILFQLPTGIFWYIRMITYWYIVFYISKSIRNSKNRYVFIMIMSSIISFVYIKDRIYLWQIFSFPLGLVISDNLELFKKYIEKNFKYITIYSFLISIVAVILKKTPYVDNRTFGFCDTTLQIVINLSLAIFIGMMVYILQNINLWRFAQVVGKKSYEIYLVHPFFLYWLSDRRLLTMITYLITVSVLSIIFNYVNKFLSKRLF